MHLTKGIKNRVEVIVNENNLASNTGNPKVDVFATSKMVELLEKVATKLLTPYLKDGQVSVASYVELEHLAASPLGMKIKVEAELIKIEGRRLLFKVIIRDQKEKIGEAMHERYIVDLAGFQQRTDDKLD